MTNRKTGQPGPASGPAPPEDVASGTRPKPLARSTDSATLQRSALPALARFIEAKHAELVSPAGDSLLAVRGDTMAARAVLARFIDHVQAHRLGAATADAWPDLDATVDVVTLILAQPNAAIGSALGFQVLRASRADRIVALVVFYAVDHAQHGMGEFRTLEDACRMVATTSARLVGKVFPRPLTADAAQKTFKRAKVDDPNGQPQLLQRARRIRDR